MWACYIKCFALGGTWPNVDYQLPAVLACKQDCGVLCTPPLSPPPRDVAEGVLAWIDGVRRAAGI